MKNVAILCLGLVVSQISFAQVGSNAVDSDFRFGLKGSMNFGWIQPTSKNVEGSGVMVGFSYGPMADYFFRPNYALSMELLISQINGSVTLGETQRFLSDPDSNDVTNLEYRYRNQYVELPISLKFRTKEIGYMSYWANFGIAPSFLIQARASLEGGIPASVLADDPTKFRTNDDEGDPFTTDHFNDQVSLIRIPLIIGAGVDYKLAGRALLHGGLRFSNSFTDMFVKDKGVSAKNNYISLNVGVFF